MLGAGEVNAGDAVDGLDGEAGWFGSEDPRPPAGFDGAVPTGGCADAGGEGAGTWTITGAACPSGQLARP